MRKRGRTLWEDLSIILQGIREFDAILPGQMHRVTLHSLCVSLAPYVAIYMSAQIINEMSGSMDSRRLGWYVLATIGATLLLKIFSSRLQAKISVGYSQLFTAHEIRLNEKAYDLPYTSLEDASVRELRDQVSGSIDISGAGMGSLYWDMESLTQNLCSAVIALALCADIFFQAPAKEMTGAFGLVNSTYAPLLLIALIIVSAGLSSKMTSKLFDVSFDVFKNGANYNRYANFYLMEYLSDDKSAKDVRIFSQKKLIVDETQQRCYLPFCAGDKREKLASSKYNGVKLLLSALAGGAVYAFIGLKALSGTVGIGSVVMAYSAVTMLILALSDFSMTFTDLRNNNDHLKLYFEYMNLPNQRDTGTLPAEFGAQPEIRFEHVSFRYPHAHSDALQDISLTVPHGKRLAIVGMNGSGKTTLIKLLCGLHEPTEGGITVNGQRISSYRYREYTGHFSVVFQDFRLLSFSIGQNVAASAQFDTPRVEACLRMSGLGEKLARLQHGVNQALYHDYDEDGVSLSGGEEQKLAIARAMYKNASIFVLDEPTAALDPRAEYETYQKFDKLTGNKTTFFISHRLSSCRFCDEVIVMDQGRVVQQGTHDELVNSEGRYRELWSAQSQYYTDGAAEQ